mmetsp:Transcript_9723/g.26372  ORF Transcript_9723/g.26372 Transcript_9723/m.26372 type:complete len:262 (-) Transcript_9723:941-1726(-)
MCPQHTPHALNLRPQPGCCAHSGMGPQHRRQPGIHTHTQERKTRSHRTAARLPSGLNGTLVVLSRTRRITHSDAATATVAATFFAATAPRAHIADAMLPHPAHEVQALWVHHIRCTSKARYRPVNIILSQARRDGRCKGPHTLLPGGQAQLLRLQQHVPQLHSSRGAVTQHRPFIQRGRQVHVPRPIVALPSLQHEGSIGGSCDIALLSHQQVPHECTPLVPFLQRCIRGLQLLGPFAVLHKELPVPLLCEAPVHGYALAP